MSLSDLFMIVGFALAAYSIIANDSIQTLGTFIASNAHRRWWILWIFISGIMIITVSWGWASNGGDPAFGRLGAEGKNIPLPATFSWLFVVPPLCLVILTRYGIPVSTSLLVLTSFKALVAAQAGKDSKGAIDLFKGMMEKSLVGYAIAFVLGLVIYLAVLAAFERYISAKRDAGEDTKPAAFWTVFQWSSTGFLWSMWLVQDLANIFCFLPRELSLFGLVASLVGMTLLQGLIFRSAGGKIQKIVSAKTNTMDVRSATFIDLLYGLVLLFFKLDILDIWPRKMPMSTTWVFLGLLAGRELGIAIRLRNRSRKKLSRLIFGDAGKAFVGSVIAIVLALTLPLLVFATAAPAPDPAAAPDPALQVPESAAELAPAQPTVEE